MGLNRQRIEAKEKSAIAVSIGTMLLVFPTRRLWSFAGAPWWAPLVLWVGLLLLGVWIAKQDDNP